MSDTKIAAVVCEGQTDFPVLREILLELWPELDEVRPVQPETDETGKSRQGHPAGWSAVKQWCEQHADSLDEFFEPLIGDPIDLLLVAIDMDIALEAGIANPPKEIGAYESPRLRSTVASWLKPQGRRLPKQVLLATPVLAIESWIVAAVFPREKSPEKLAAPADFLMQKEVLRPSPRDGKVWKELHRYRDLANRVARKLDHVRKVCPEAERVCSSIETRRDEVMAA